MRLLLIAGVTLALAPGPATARADDDVSTQEPGAFGEAGSMSSGRVGHASATLPDGRVLVIGGERDGGPAKRVEIWDPDTGEFSRVGSLKKARPRVGAVTLRDGRVLVFGGEGPGGILRSAEIWDPATGAFTPTGRLRKPRFASNGVVLPDGRVVIAGGAGDRYLDTIEAWDPESGRFERVGRLPRVRALHTTTALLDGRVLVVGGLTENRKGVTRILADALVFDPATGSLAEAGTMAAKRSHHTATLLADGRVLVVGGDDWDQALASAEVWDPATDSFTSTGSMAEPRAYHTATALPDGRVLVAGGTDGDQSALATAEVWDPATGAFSPTGPLLEGRQGHTAEALPDGRVLILGGMAETTHRSAELWDPTARHEDPPPPASLKLASCVDEADERAAALRSRFPSSLQGLPVTAEACTGSDWLAMHAHDDAAGSATLARAGRLLDEAGKAAEDLTVATAHHRHGAGQSATITALRVAGARASDLVDLAIPLMLGIERPAYRHRSVGQHGPGVVEVRDETIPGGEATTIYTPLGDTVWFVRTSGPQLLAEVIEALPGPGGRFESTDLGVAITFPDDWLVAERPERMGRNDDMGTGAIQWLVTSGSAIGERASMPGGCWLQLYRPSELGAKAAFRRLAGGGEKGPKPEVLDGGLLRMAGPGTFVGGDADAAMYVTSSDGAVALLICVVLDSERPDHLWLPIAESIELFAPESGRTADADATSQPVADATPLEG